VPISISACCQTWTIIRRLPFYSRKVSEDTQFPSKKKGKCLISDIHIDSYLYNRIYTAGLRVARQNSQVRRTARNCPGYCIANQRPTFNHNIRMPSAAMKTLFLLIITFPVLLARHLRHQVRSICFNSSVACLILCIIIYKDNIPKFCDFFLFFRRNFKLKYIK